MQVPIQAEDVLKMTRLRDVFWTRTCEFVERCGRTMHRASAHPQLSTSGASSDDEHLPVCRDGYPYFSLRRFHSSSNLYFPSKWITAHFSMSRYVPAVPI